MKSAYEVLGVPRDADDAGIERAYFALLARPQAWSKIEALKEAYRTLSDPTRRKRHDFLAIHPFRLRSDLPPVAEASPEQAHARRAAEMHFDVAVRQAEESGWQAHVASGFEKALELVPDFVAARANLVLLHVSAGRDEAAVSQAEELARFPGSPPEIRELRSDLRTLLGLDAAAEAPSAAAESGQHQAATAAREAEEPGAPALDVTGGVPVPPPPVERSAAGPISRPPGAESTLRSRAGVLAALRLLRILMETRTGHADESDDIGRLMDAVLEQVPTDLAAVGCDDLRPEFRNIGAFLLSREHRG